MLELTEAQCRSVLQGEAVRLPMPDIGQDVVILRADAYEEIREILEDERERRAIAKVAVRNAAARLLDEERE